MKAKPTTAEPSDLHAIPIAFDDLFSVQDLAKAHPAILTEATVRWYLRHRDSNGLAPACVPLGKKLLLSGRRFEAWLATRTVAA